MHTQRRICLKKVSIVIFIVILVIGGGYIQFRLKSKEISEKAIEAGTQYIKEKYNLEQVVTDYYIYPVYVSDQVSLSGFIKDHKDYHISLFIDYKDNYKIIDFMAPSIFYEKYGEKEK
ncbi:hypothetical protein D3C71_1262380 [compost metagenome]